jgi:hypothetical protein
MAVPCPSFIEAVDVSLCRAVDIYCERTNEAFLAEPVNALTNFAFLLTAWFAWCDLRRESTKDAGLLAVVVGTVPVVAIGSFAYHTIATRWAEWADVVPILFFMLSFLWLIARRYLGWSAIVSALAIFGFVALTFGIEAQVPSRILWGGAMYVPTIVALLAIAASPIKWSATARANLFTAVGIFILSFGFRILDAPTCTAFPLGTHFLWHILNAVFLYLLLRAAILHSRTRAVCAV